MAIVRLTGIKVVVFDLDDTLYPERQFVLSGFRAVGSWLRQRLTCPCDPVRRMVELFDSGDRSRVFDGLLAEWSCPHTKQWLPQMIECYRTHKPEIALHPDASRSIERLQKSFQLSLISDGPLQTQRNKIEALDLGTRIEPVILTDEWGEAFRKPHLRAFEYLERSTAFRGRQCVYIGDNRLKDFVAPNLLGWRSVCVERKDGIYVDARAPTGGTPETNVSTFDELFLED
jgi:putative hydrolase of the HAD superfamily